MGCMALITATVLCGARSEDLLLSESVHRVRTVFSTAGLRVEESHVIRHVNLLCC